MTNEQMLKALEASTSCLSKIVDRLYTGNSGPKIWSSPGEFLHAIWDQAVSRRSDLRLKNTATWSGEQDGPAGGFALGPQQGDLATLIGDGSFFSRFDPIPTQSSLLQIGSDEAADWTEPATIAKEGAVVAATKPDLKQKKIPLYTLRPMHHVADKMDRDTNGTFANYVFKRLVGKIAAGIESYVLRGTGLDEPVGLLNAPGRVVIDAQSTESTLAVSDIAGMLARLVPGGYGRSFWIMHSTFIPLAASLGANVFTTTAEGMFLMGRPVVVSEWCNEAGVEGDLVLVDPAGCLAAIQGVRQYATPVFCFEQGLNSFKAVCDFGFAPVLAAPVARRVSGMTVGHVITFASRME